MLAGGYVSVFAYTLGTYRYHHVLPPGSPWGAGTFAGADSSHKLTAPELANIQGEHFYSVISQAKL